jgi:acyl-CoA thioesterase-2
MAEATRSLVMPEIDPPRQSLDEIMGVQRRAEGSYLASLEDFWGASDEGDLLARIVLAAAPSAPHGSLRSLHARLFRPAPPDVALRLRVEALDELDGASLAVRVDADGPACHATLDFSGALAEGVSYQDVSLPTGLPAPETLPSTIEQARQEGWPEEYARGPIEFRRIGSLERDRKRGESSAHETWVQPRVALAGDATRHAAATAFLAGFYDHWEYECRIGAAFDHGSFGPREIALWRHRDESWDDWWLLRATSEVCHGGIALGRREIFTRDGRLVASAVCSAAVRSSDS